MLLLLLPVSCCCRRRRVVVVVVASEFLFEMNGGVEDDPHDEEAGERREESLLRHLHRPAEFLIINRLEVSEVNVKETGVDGNKRGEAGDAAERNDAPDGAENKAQDLTRPVDHVEELVLIGPLGFCGGDARPKGREDGLLTVTAAPLVVLHHDSFWGGGHYGLLALGCGRGALWSFGTWLWARGHYGPLALV